ncbi:MAG TPA: hypothetical protein VFQ53_30080 [Kofleriaceae bacterium]|nr:hypothetical protein [Kofleriaceae bacterium]
MLAGLGACGGGGGSTTPDAPVVEGNPGFARPTAALKANNEDMPDKWVELGPADLTCLGTPANDPATTVAVELSTVVRDFQSDSLVPGATVTAFKNQDLTTPFFTGTADGNAAITIDIPVGVQRFGYKMTHETALDTLLLNQTVDPSMSSQTVSSIQTVSKSTGQTLPALIGVSRSAGTGVLAGAIRDCQGHEISNFIATVTTNPARTASDIMHVAGADTYYFSSTVGLPVRHTQKAMGSEDGLFMVIELSAAPTAYVQVWGYPTDADLASDNLTLIAELQTQVIADTVITGSYEPLRTP